MCRAFFLAIGFFVMILGVECLGVERVSLKDARGPAGADFAVRHGGEGGAHKQIVPPPGHLGACWPRAR